MIDVQSRASSTGTTKSRTSLPLRFTVKTEAEGKTKRKNECEACSLYFRLAGLFSDGFRGAYRHRSASTCSPFQAEDMGYNQESPRPLGIRSGRRYSLSDYHWGMRSKGSVPIIDQTARVLSIYVFCFDEEAHKNWAAKYSQVIALCEKRERIDGVRNERCRHFVVRSVRFHRVTEDAI